VGLPVWFPVKPTGVPVWYRRPVPTQGIHLGPGAGVTVENPLGGPLTFKARGHETNGRMVAFESTAAPGEGPPLHVHANEDEVVYALEGTFRFQLDGEVRDAPPGSFMFIPRGAAHTWQNVGSTPGRLLVLFTPAGMEAFFERFAEDAGEASPAEAFRRFGREAGMDVVGPPLASAAAVQPDAPARPPQPAG
jgi:quercetin dioxygenase-like cupin family protein